MTCKVCERPSTHVFKIGIGFPLCETHAEAFYDDETRRADDLLCAQAYAAEAFQIARGGGGWRDAGALQDVEKERVLAVAARYEIERDVYLRTLAWARRLAEKERGPIAGMDVHVEPDDEPAVGDEPAAEGQCPMCNPKPWRPEDYELGFAADLTTAPLCPHHEQETNETARAAKRSE